MMKRFTVMARSEAAFTLIEAIVSMTLMMSVLIALSTVTAQWLPNWNRGISRVQQVQAFALGIERAVADIAAAEYIWTQRDTRKPLFDGSELAVTFVRSAVGPNVSLGLIEVVRISESLDGQSPALVRTSTPFGMNIVELTQLTFSNPVILARPFRFSFLYAGPDGVWQPRWRQAERLPKAVKIVVRDPRSEQILNYSTVAMIHVDAPADCISGDAAKANCLRDDVSSDSRDDTAARR